MTGRDDALVQGLTVPRSSASTSNPRSFGLEYLLNPLPSAEFFSAYYDQRHFFQKRKRPQHYDALVSLNDFDSVLAQNDMRYPEARVIRNGLEVPPRYYTLDTALNGHGLPDYIDHDRLLQEFAAGGTIVLDFLHLRLPRLQRLCDELYSSFSAPAQVNAYITPPGERALQPHYDTHSTFILQIAGRKRWTLFDSCFPLPLPRQEFTCPEGGVMPEESLVLAPGDVLYIPRGRVHAARTLGKVASVHLTVAVRTVTWQDVLELLIQSCDRDAQFRKSVRPDLGSRPLSSSEIVTVLNDAVAAIQSMDLEGEVNRQLQMKGEIFRSRDQSGRFLSTNQASLIREGSRLFLRDLAAELLDVSSTAVVRSGSREFCIPERLRPAVALVIAKQKFTPSEIFDSVGPEELEFLKELIAWGLVGVETR